jgi:cation transport regulator ChaB
MPRRQQKVEEVIAFKLATECVRMDSAQGGFF